MIKDKVTRDQLTLDASTLLLDPHEGRNARAQFSIVECNAAAVASVLMHDYWSDFRSVYLDLVHEHSRMDAARSSMIDEVWGGTSVLGSISSKTVRQILENRGQAIMVLQPRNAVALVHLIKHFSVLNKVAHLTFKKGHRKHIREFAEDLFKDKPDEIRRSLGDGSERLHHLLSVDEELISIMLPDGPVGSEQDSARKLLDKLVRSRATK